MYIERFAVAPHNSYYERACTEEEMRWHRINAIEKTNNILTMLNGRTVESVLEVGCGSGVVLSELARRKVGTSLEGVDVLPPQPCGTSELGDLSIHHYDGDRLPFADGAFDFVYASHVVEHVLNPRAFIAEVVRVSRRLVYFEVPCELNARTSHRLIQRALDIGHINYFSPDTFLLLLQTCDVEVADFRLFTHGIDFYRGMGSALTAPVKMALKNSLLAVNWRLASNLFTYHCGAMVERPPPA